MDLFINISELLPVHLKMDLLRILNGLGWILAYKDSFFPRNCEIMVLQAAES